MKIDEAKGTIACALGGGCSQVCNTKYRGLCSDEKVIEAMRLAVKCMDEKESGKWIPVVYRKPFEFLETDLVMCADELPEDGQEVIITTNKGYVTCTNFYSDCGYYFDGYEDEGEVIAWMPLPLPYVKKGVSLFES